MNSSVRRFPVLLALATLVFYGVTLSRGVTVDNLGLVSKINGWDWKPWVGHPLLWLFALPLRVMPEGWVPVLLNLFSALSAAVTLGILARSVELTPWFRPSAMAEAWRRRLPGLVGAIACGLELNFWRNATAATGEMLEVLVLAGAIWCLLEFRENRNDRWLHASVIVWGLGMAENWVMIVTLPLFVLWVYLMQPRRFLRVGFSMRLAGLGLAGFLVYALVPLANGLARGSPWSFAHAWHNSLRHTRETLGVVSSMRSRGSIGIMVLVFYLLPAFACFVCSHNKPSSHIALLGQLEVWLFRTIRALLLVMCLWLALDPVIGPRAILKQAHLALPLLSFDLLNGLAAGILAGNMLQLGQRKSGWLYFTTVNNPLFQWQQRAALPLVLTGGISTLTMLLARNAPLVNLVNRVPLVQFGDLALRSLPAGAGIMFSDFSDRLEVFQAAEAQHRERPGWLAVDVGALSFTEYRSWLSRKYPQMGLPGGKGASLTFDDLRVWMENLATSNRIFNLTAGAGYFLESFYQVPVGSVYELRVFARNVVNAPELPAALIAENEKIWDSAGSQIDLLKKSVQDESEQDGLLRRYLNLDRATFEQGEIPSRWYSMALNSWGVELQRAGRLAEAQRRFVQAIGLNTNNWIARNNLSCNERLRSNARMDLAGVSKLALDVGDINRLLAQCGPADEPTFCFLLGLTNSQENLPRQAMQQFERAAVLAPQVLAPQFTLASLYIRYQFTNQASAAIARIREGVSRLASTNLMRIELSFLETDFYQSQGNLAQATQILSDVASNHAEDTDTLARVVQKFIWMRNFTNADEIVTGRLARTPDDPFLLQLKSGLLMEFGLADQAIPVLNHLLSLTNSPQAKFGRGLAYLRATNYAAAQEDFLSLRNSSYDPYEVNYGLAETSLGRGDTNLGVKYLNECLSGVPTNSARWKVAAARLRVLGQGGR